LDANYRELTHECGVPAAVLESEDDWAEFLDHGWFAPASSGPIIDIDTMPQGQVLRLCQFLEEQVRSGGHGGLTLTWLQDKLGREKHSG
jgi:hypothetical protein